MKTRLMLKIEKDLERIEKQEKSIEETTAALETQKGIEDEKLTKHEHQTRWILDLPGGSID